jgi:hypothetical protein
MLHLGPNDYITLVEARLKASRELEEVHDDLFRWARYLYLVTRSGYAVEQPHLATDPELGHMMNAPTSQDMLNSACLDLLTIIGFVLMSMEPDAPKESALFDPGRSPLATTSTSPPRGTRHLD